MKFRIHYETEGAYWCIQFSHLGLFWRTAVEHRALGERTVLRFPTFDEADAYVVSSGIESAYTQWVDPAVRACLAAEEGAKREDPGLVEEHRGGSLVHRDCMSPDDFMSLLNKGSRV